MEWKPIQVCIVKIAMVTELDNLRSYIGYFLYMYIDYAQSIASKWLSYNE